MRRLIFLMPAAVLAAGCSFFQGDPYAGEYTTTEPQERDLVGAWEGVGEPRGFLETLGYNEAVVPHVELNADGTFTMADIPDVWRHAPAEAARTLESGAGKWSIDRQEEWYCLRMDFSTINGQPQNYSIYFMLLGHAEPYLIHIMIGDPDSSDCIEFGRQ
jgi:hypothetical protein